MLSGSAAEGESDRYSDIDMMIYYDDLPADEALDLRWRCLRRTRHGRREMVARLIAGLQADCRDCAIRYCRAQKNEETGHEMALGLVGSDRGDSGRTSG